MLIDAITDWNPWWDDPAALEQLRGKPREELDRIEPALPGGKVTILSGVRRSGKTTLMYQMVNRLTGGGTPPKNILFLGMEDPAFTGRPVEELIMEYRKEQVPVGEIHVFLDEVQSRDGWEREIRKFLDTRKEMRFTVSGSSSSLITGEYATLLTGRNLTYFIRPLTFGSYYEFTTGSNPPKNPRGKSAERMLIAFRGYLGTGGFPEVVLMPEELKKPTLNQYFNDIIHRDIIHLHSADPRKVHQMAGYLLLNVGKIVTLSSLRRALGLSYDAIKDYIRYLEQAGLFHFVREFSFSSKPSAKERGKMKVYCCDTGMARFASGRHSRDYGRFAENAAFLHLVAKGHDTGFFPGKNEVDFVTLDTARDLMLYNVCIGGEVPEREFKGIREFGARFPRAKYGACILTEDAEGEEDGVRMVPLWKWVLGA